MFKKISFTCLFIIFYLNSFAQFWGLIPADKPVDYKEKTLIVIVEEDKISKTDFESSLKSTWNLTPYKLITRATYKLDKDSYKDKPEYIFITYNQNLNLVYLGGKLPFTGKVQDLTNRITLELLSPGLSDIASITKFLSNFQGLLQFGNTTEISKPDPIVITKTILVNEDQLFNGTEEKIKKDYPYPVKVVSSVEFSKAILEKRKGVLFFDYSTSTQKSVVMVFSMEDNSVLWMSIAKGVNNYVFYNFKYMLSKLEKAK